MGAQIRKGFEQVTLSHIDETRIAPGKAWLGHALWK
jgi:hypothetical protein